ncbi:MAG: hypothetical protein U0228_22315 [Myxococcaceae bacterium]
MRRLLLALSLAALSSSFAGCNFPTVVPEALNTEFKPTGEVLLYNRSISFDQVRVRSPICNLSKRTDGSWAGTFNNQPIDVSVTDSRITGVNVTMTREMSEGNKVIITGQFQGRIYRFELDDQQAMIRAPAKSMNLVGKHVAERETTYGPQGNLQLRGDAGSIDTSWPQLAFALMTLMQ